MFYLGVSNEGDANREFPLHPTREGLGAGLSLVFKVEDTNDPVYLIWSLVFGVAFQLDIKHINTPDNDDSGELHKVQRCTQDACMCACSFAYRCMIV